MRILKAAKLTVITFITSITTNNIKNSDGIGIILRKVGLLVYFKEKDSGQWDICQMTYVLIDTFCTFLGTEKEEQRPVNSGSLAWYYVIVKCCLHFRLLYGAGKFNMICHLFDLWGLQYISLEAFVYMVNNSSQFFGKSNHTPIIWILCNKIALVEINTCLVSQSSNIKEIVPLTKIFG